MATSATGGALYFEGGIDVAKLYEEIAKINASIKAMADNTANQGDRMDKTFGGIGSALAAIGGTAAITMLGRQILDTTAKFEKFGIVLSNTLGETQGAASLDMISKFAATTPFQLDEVTGAFIKMANQGFVPTYEEMTKLGDVASSTGKSFDQLTEAILDAQAGQFERLKEFGIKASVSGDKVTFSFKEQQTTVDNTNSSIRAYILSLGDMKGVAGANALISASLTGQLSNLQDKLAMMYNEIGKSNKGVMYSAIAGTSTLIDNYEAVGKVLMGLVAVYGTYRAAVIVTAAATSMQAATYQRLAIDSTLATAAEARAIIVKERLAATSATLNKTLLANPYALVAAAVMAVAAGIYLLATYQSDLEKATAKTDLAIENETDKASALFAELKHATEGTDEWQKAKQAIIDQYGTYLTAQQQEALGLGDIEKARTAVNDGLRESIALKIRDEALTGIREKYNSDITSSEKDIFNKIKSKQGAPAAYDFQYKVADFVAKSKDGKTTEEDLKNIRTEAMALVGDVNELGQASSFASADMAGYFTTLSAALKGQGKDVKDVTDAFDKYGKNLKSNEAVKPFDATTLSLQELMKEFPNATMKLDGLVKAEKQDPTAIANQKARTESIKAEIAAREKQLYVINDVEAQVKRLQDEQKGYAANDAGYKEREARIAALKARLPETSKKEVDQIDQVKKAMEKASGTELDLLAKKLVALEAIKKKQEDLISSSMGKAYAVSRDMDNADLSMMIGDPAKQLKANTSPVISSKSADKLKIIGLEFDKLKGKIKDNTKEADKLNQKLEDEEKQKAFEKILSLTSQISGELSGIVSKNAEKLGLDEKQQEIIQTGLKAFDQIAKGDIIGFVGTMVSTALDSILAVPEKLSERFVGLNEQIQRMLGSLKIANEALNNIGLGTTKNTLNLVQSQIISVTKAASDLSKAVAGTYYGAGQSSGSMAVNYASARVQVEALETSVKSLSNSLLGQGLSDDQRTAIEAVLQSYNELQSTLQTMIQDLTGTTVQGLSDSLAEMFWNGQVAAEAWGKTVDDIIKKVIIDQMTTSLLTKPIQAAIDQLVKDSQSGDWVTDPNATGRGSSQIETNIGLSLAEANKFKESIASISAQYAPAFEAARKSLEESGLTTDSTRTAATKGLAAMNQDTANELNGRFTAIQGHTFSINEGVRILTMNSASMLKSLQGIESNSKIWQRLEAIDQNIAIMNGNVESINLKGITLKK